MKYIVFKTEAGVFYPVIFPEHVTHSTVSITEDKTIKVDSAGFFSINFIKGRNLNVLNVVVSSQKATSLNVNPDIIRDGKLIEALLMNMGMYAFTSFQ